MSICRYSGHKLERQNSGVYSCTNGACEFTLVYMVPCISPVKGRAPRKRRQDLMHHTCDLILNERIWSLKDGRGVPLSALDRAGLERLNTWLRYSLDMWGYTTDLRDKILESISEVSEVIRGIQ